MSSAVSSFFADDFDLYATQNFFLFFFFFFFFLLPPPFLPRLPLVTVWQIANLNCIIVVILWDEQCFVHMFCCWSLCFICFAVGRCAYDFDYCIQILLSCAAHKTSSCTRSFFQNSLDDQNNKFEKSPKTMTLINRSINQLVVLCSFLHFFIPPSRFFQLIITPSRFFF